MGAVILSKIRNIFIASCLVALFAGFLFCVPALAAESSDSEVQDSEVQDSEGQDSEGQDVNSQLSEIVDTLNSFQSTKASDLDYYESADVRLTAAIFYCSVVNIVLLLVIIGIFLGSIITRKWYF